jgi:predicted nucleic acid-binding Zn ribbon protein
LPTYTYKDLGLDVHFDVVQSIHDPALEVNPVTGNPCVKVIHAVPVHFKGSGFYSTTK